MTSMGVFSAQYALLLLLVSSAGQALAVDPVWSTVAPIPTARRECAAVAVGGTIYVIGGYGPDYANILSTVEAYDTATTTWTTKASLPVPTRGIQSSGLSIGGTIYVAGGFPALYGCCSATLWAYDTATDTWKAESLMPTPRGVASAVRAQDKVFVIGGYNGFFLSTVEIYDPSTGTWATAAPMPTGREGLAVAVAGGAIYAIGGGGLSSRATPPSKPTTPWQTHGQRKRACPCRWWTAVP